jgi:hypothetical protein
MPNKGREGGLGGAMAGRLINPLYFDSNHFASLPVTNLIDPYLGLLTVVGTSMYQVLPPVSHQKVDVEHEPDCPFHLHHGVHP